MLGIFKLLLIFAQKLHKMRPEFLTMIPMGLCHGPAPDVCDPIHTTSTSLKTAVVVVPTYDSYVVVRIAPGFSQ